MYATVYALTPHRYMVLRKHDNTVLAIHRTYSDAQQDARNRNIAAHAGQPAIRSANDAQWAGRR